MSRKSVKLCSVHWGDALTSVSLSVEAQTFVAAVVGLRSCEAMMVPVLMRLYVYV